MMLLSCDVKAAPRPLEYIHARVGIAVSPLGVQAHSCRPARGNEALRARQHQQGRARAAHAEEVT